MAGPPKIQPAVYGDISQLSQMGLKNSPRENLPRFVDRTAGRPGKASMVPPRRSPGARQRGRMRPSLPSSITSEMRVAAQNVARASKYLQIAQQAAASGDAGPEVMRVLERAQYNYARALYEASQVTSTFETTEDF